MSTLTLELMLAFGVASVLSRYISRRSLLVICFSVGLPAKSRVLASPSTLWFMFKDPRVSVTLDIVAVVYLICLYQRLTLVL